jgi:outer membrane protein assembly factor BamB
VVVTGVGRDGTSLVTTCLDPKSGGARWTAELRVPELEKVHPLTTHSASTPVTDGERTFAFFGSFGMVAYDRAGRELWRKPFAPPRNKHGSASSPVLYDGRLIQLADAGGKPFVVALDPGSGRELWKRERPRSECGWSTPVLWRTKRGDELVVLGPKRLDAFDPRTGASLWWLGGFPDNAITVPLVDGSRLDVNALGIGSISEIGYVPHRKDVERHDKNGDGRIELEELPASVGWKSRNEASLDTPGVFFSSRDDFKDMDADKDGGVTAGEWEKFVDSIIGPEPKNRILAIEEGAAGDAASKVVWENRKGVTEVPSPVLYDGRIYTVRDGGRFACLDASDGSVLYLERLPVAVGQYFASPVVAKVTDGAFVLTASARGLVSVLRAGPAFEVVREVDLGEPISATPAIDAARGRIYVRTAKGLRAYGSKGE